MADIFDIRTLIQNTTNTVVIDKLEADVDTYKGEPGYTPVKGTDYEDGEEGIPGKSAYELAFEVDSTIGTNTDWLESLKGEQGDTITGPKGPAGNSVYKIKYEGTVDTVNGGYIDGAEAGKTGQLDEYGAYGDNEEFQFMSSFRVYNGADGISMLSGEGAPASTLGINGYTYYDSVNFIFYYKKDDVWEENADLPAMVEEVIVANVDAQASIIAAGDAIANSRTAESRNSAAEDEIVQVWTFDSADGVYTDEAAYSHADSDPIEYSAYHLEQKALQAKNAAESAKNISEDAQAAALSSESKAAKWAESDEEVETDAYSAKYHATIAADKESQISPYYDAIAELGDAVTSDALDRLNTDNTADNIDVVGTNIADVVTVADEANTDTYTDKDGNTDASSIHVIAESVVDIRVVADDTLAINEVADNIDNVTNAVASAETASTKAEEANTSRWEAKAAQATADSYAMEAEDVVVKVWSVNDAEDGIESVDTDPAEYSAVHWANKSEGTLEAANTQLSANQNSIAINAQAIANMGTAQASVSGAAMDPILADWTKLDYTVVGDSTDTDILELDDTADTITFKKNASYNLHQSLMVEALSANSRDLEFRIITVGTSKLADGTDVADGTVVVSKTKTLENPNGDTESLEILGLLTVGRNDMPAAPVTMRLELKQAEEDYKLLAFDSVIASSSSYDLSVSIVHSDTLGRESADSHPASAIATSGALDGADYASVQELINIITNNNGIEVE